MQTPTLLALLATLALICSPAAALRCSGKAIYTFLYDGMWSEARHGPSFPEGGMFSPIGFVTHNKRWFMWKPNTVASKGTQNVAETGDATVLGMESTFNCGPNCGPYIQMPCMPMGSGTCDTTFQFTATRRKSYFSFETMFAPSPDWFSGISMYNLCNETTGTWIPSAMLDPRQWDAGTDSGPDFTSPDEVTMPQELVSLIVPDVSSPFYNTETGMLPPTGKVNITLLKTHP